MPIIFVNQIYELTMDFVVNICNIINKYDFQRWLSKSDFACLFYIRQIITTNMIQGAPKFIMIAFFALGILFIGFSLWALYLTDIPQEQFVEDPRFEEEYTKYYQWLTLFGGALVIIGWILAFLGRKMGRNQGSKLDWFYYYYYYYSKFTNIASNTL